MKLSRDSLKILDAGQLIRAEPPEDCDKQYMTRYFIQCTLPHEDPGEVPVWKRRNGNLLLSIVPGTDHRTGRSFGYPYGSIPRLLLFWITTEARRHNTRRLKLGRNIADYMRALGLNPGNGTGKRSDTVRLHDQMMRLCRAQVSFDTTRIGGRGWNDMQVAPMGRFWWDENRPDEPLLWESWIELGEKFFIAIMQSTVPFDLRAIRALKRSPLALDLYTLVNYHGATLKSSHYVSWTMLMQQMGGNYTDPKQFGVRVNEHLRKVRTVLPGVRVEHERGGIRIHPGSPAISRQASLFA